jgi:hypothetical protein
MRIASRAEASVIFGDSTITFIIVRQQLREVDQHVARHVDDRHSNAVAELFLQLQEGAAVGHQRRIDRRFGRKDGQIVVRADHGALDEQAVDAARVLDGVGQAAPRFEIERERAGAEMDVEIEQRGRSLGPSALNSQASDVAMVDAPTPPRVPMTAAATCAAWRRASWMLGLRKHRLRLASASRTCRAKAA